MAYYSSLEQFKNDFSWLSKECTLEHFSYSRLSEYEFLNIAGQINKRIDDPFVEDVFNQFLSKVNLQSSMWEKKLTRSMFPVLALIPGAGFQVIFDINANGTYKSMDASGNHESESFPENTIFRMLKFQRKKSALNSSIAMFKSIAIKQKKYLNYAFIATISTNILGLGVAFYTMQVYDRVISTNGMSTLIALTIGVVIALILEIILKFSRNGIVEQAIKNMDIEFSHNIFNRFLNLRADSLPSGIGTLANKINSYSVVRGFITSSALFIFIDFPFAFFFLGIITLVGGYKIGLLILMFLLIVSSIGFAFKNKIELLTRTSTLASHRKHGLLVETVENAIKVKTSGARWSILNKWNQFSDDAANDEILIHHFTEISVYVASLFQQLSYVLTVSFGAFLIGSTSDLTMGTLIAITILSNKVFAPISQIPGLFVSWAKAKVAVDDLDMLYKMPSDNENVDRPITSKLKSYKIECRDLKYAYNEDSIALDLPNLQIQQGEKVAILGTIGSGKSTLIKVLSGAYKPGVGKVLIDGIDMQQLSRDIITDTVSYLDQDTKLFSGTLRDNLTHGLLDISDEHILSASKLTGLSHLIAAIPKGLDSIVPEGGQSVSGGQRQMIALTRVLIAKSKVLLLDEPTASMDVDSERLIVNMLQKTITKEQTLVIVTHKPLILNLVDRIIILDEKGGIVRDGKKEDILKEININQNKNKS